MNKKARELFNRGLPAIPMHLIWDIENLPRKRLRVTLIVEDEEGTPLFNFGSVVMTQKGYIKYGPCYLIPKLGSRVQGTEVRLAFDPDEMKVDVQEEPGK